MKGSPVFPGFDTDYHDTSNGYEFDPQTDFAQFLDEARRYANDKEDCAGKIDNKGQVNAEKQSNKKKKSWRTALFSFWKKTQKKNKQCTNEASSSMGSHFASPTPRGHVSGPIYRNGGVRAAHRLPASGPLMSLFHTKKRGEDAMPTPYVSLGKVNKMQYGGAPYLVS